MFLFKNTKSIIKRIGMNLAVYGFAGSFVLMMLALFLPKVIANYVYVSMVICSFAAIIGSIISIVWFIYELTPYAINKQIKREINISNQNIIYSYGVKTPGSLFETVELKKENGVYHYVTVSMIDKWNGGGEKLSVPDIFIKNDSVDVNELLVYIANKHSYMGSMSEYRTTNISLNEPKTIVFKMITKEGQRHKFTYSGHTRYSPNRSSTSGYGSDDWFYLCEENSTYYLLMFTDNAGFGTGWMYTELLEGDFENLIKEDVNYWGSIAYSKERTKTYAIRLTDVDSVRHLLPTSSRCCSKLTDEHYLR